MTTSAARIRQGLHRDRSITEELKSIRRLLSRTYLDEQIIVKRARKAGIPWARIGELLGLTESGARRRYRARGIE